MRVHPTGTVTVFTGSHSHGQGHETTFAQVVAAKLGIPVENVEIVHGDTGRVPFGMGTYGSRSLSVGGTAIVKAVDKIIAKGKKIAAHLLEAADTDIEFENGEFKVKGTDKKVPFGAVALTAYVPHNYPLDKLEPGLNENAFYDPTNFTYPAGSYVCEVEVDPETGKTRVEQFTAVDDFGNIVNPMIVAGQVHGGIAQGLGQAMMEGCVYDPESGQLLTGSYMDYTMPRADDLPSFTVDHTVTPCTHNPLGVKGCGEAGAIGSPPAFINALTDALGVRDIAMPATAERVWRAANKHRLTTRTRRQRMYTFDYQRPASARRGAAALQGDARYLAGGQSLVQAMKLRLSSAERLVDLGGVADLKGIKIDGGNVVDRRDDDARRGGALGRRAKGASRRWPNWPAASATRWCATWARSAARSPTPTRRPAIRRPCSVSARRCTPTSARSPPTTSSPACTKRRCSRAN